jgi:hypothetical protein
MTSPAHFAATLAAFAALLGPMPAAAQASCQGAGPQAPRDISQVQGSNPVAFPFAPAASAMNLCNIHTHTNAEHKGPGFSAPGGDGQFGGWKCSGDESKQLSAAELVDPGHGHDAYGEVKPGDSIEVHWVYTSCPVSPGDSLKACGCDGAVLRVESQVFLVVNNPAARNFADYDYAGNASGKHQPKSLPDDTGSPVVFLGSTTGDKFGKNFCSTDQVTWSVRPSCAKLDINSLNRWAGSTRLFEKHSHGVRQLITDTTLLAPIAAAR